MLLVELEPERALQQRREPERANAEQLRRDARVEEPARVPAVILMQQPEIVVGVVKHLLDRVALEDSPERSGLSDRQRIEHRGEVARAHLQQIDSIDESMEAGSLRVHGHGGALLHGRQKTVGGRCGINVQRFVHGQPCGHVSSLCNVCCRKLSSGVTEREGLRARSATARHAALPLR